MPDNLSCTSKLREHHDYSDSACTPDGAGGYSKADGTVAYSKASATRGTSAAHSAAASGSAPRPKAVAGLVEGKSPKPWVAAARQKQGTKLEVGTVDVHGSKDGVKERVELARGSVGGPALKGEASLVGAELSLGTKNADGSTGVHAKVDVSAACLEASYESGAESMSVSVSTGFSAGLSIGSRDADRDGVPETCWSVSAAVSVAACTEDAAPPQNDSPATGAHGAGGTYRHPSQGGSGGTSGF